uniref:Uncharacterized protein n=1 Tax=viral metagenome TaxID=1070528 RepID=A0A6C0E021_9ZZZZ
MCHHIQLQNFISDKEEELIEESLMFVDDYDMPELIDSDLIDIPELINGEYFYDRPELDVGELLEAYISEYIAENEYVREDNQ